VFYGLLMLGAAIAANLIVNHYGPSSTPYVAFGLIGCDIVARDRLHLNLVGMTRWLTIGALIALGSLATYIINQGAGDIALASVVAFALALTVDTVVFQLARGLDPHRRVNVSNLFAAGTDTLIFFAIAFGLGNVPFYLLFGQFTAKVAGGAVWALFLVRHDADELYSPEAEVAEPTLARASQL
jgi:queuosine precursor transporter